MQTSGSFATHNRRPNYLYSVISVALVLLLMGLFGLWLLQAAHLGNTLKENIDILVELDEFGSNADRNQLEQFLAGQSYVKPGSVSFRSKESALAEMGDEINKDLIDLDLPNPFRDMLAFNVKAAYLQQDSLEKVAQLVAAEPGVLDVYYQENFIERVTANARRLAFLFLGLGLLLIIIAGVLIHNTVRLSLYANRFLIKNQELVGATWSFISRPYLRRAFWHGLVSGVLAVTALLAIQLWLQQQAPELRLFERSDWLVVLYGAMVVLGISISYFSHYTVVRRYLRMRVDDLY